MKNLLYSNYSVSNTLNNLETSKKEKGTRRALLIYPEFGQKSNFSLIHKKLFPQNKHGYTKAVMPPLGLLCIVNLIVEKYGRENIKLIDMNTQPLKQEDLEWSTEVYLSAMLTQSVSFDEVAAKAKALGKTTIGGGPYVSTNVPNLDYVFLNEAEKTLESFLRDFFTGKSPQKIHEGEKPKNDEFFRPDYSWINPNDYNSMCIQFSRGCPHDCEFCDITQRYGRKMRTKDTDIFLEELGWIYKTGWRGDVFIIDDNFIGKPKAALELLEVLAVWQKKHRYPFQFYTQLTLLLAEDRFEELLKAFYPAGFYMVFIGIETPSEASLKETNKLHNLRGNVSLAEKIKKIQRVGKLLILGGFIVGFDSDDESIFDRQERFINEEIKIPLPAISILNALPHTHLETRLKKEGRKIDDSSGKFDSADQIDINFTPKGMGRETLKKGYVDLLQKVYLDKKKFYSRCNFALKFIGRPLIKGAMKKGVIMTFCKLIFFLGILDKKRWLFWKFILGALMRHPLKIVYAFRLAGYGFHYQMLTELRVKNFESQYV